ncbi:MAG: hypothetical protein NWQ09_10195, partial [Nonlabens sp.]|nr:hypothetical protein [Nonlabens sp.]
PKNWKGFGVGTRFSWSGGPGSVGDKNEDYFFNYYNFSASLKYYFFSNTFNNGFYLRSSIGTGQLTSKRANDLEKSYTHQFAIGTTLTGNIGYTIPLNEIKSAQALSLELHFETSNRNGTIDGIGDKTFKTGQIGANVIFSF